MLSFPRSPQSTHRRRLPGPGRAHQHIKDTAGDRDLHERVGLILAEHPTLRIGTSGDLLDRRQRHGRPGRGAGAVEQSVFGGQEQLFHRRACPTF